MERKQCLDGNPTLFIESQLNGRATIALAEDLLIPARVEVLVNGRVGRKPKSEVGMVRPVESSSEFNLGSNLDNLQVAYAVVEPQDRIVPVKVMNTSNKPIELVAGTQLAEFCPLV